MFRRIRAVFADETTPADKVHLPHILRQETVGGVLMLVAAAVALLWANLAPHSYHTIGHTYIGPLSVAHWASDGLLTIFFFVAGLELKRELVEGSLRKPASALVPIMAAIFGMAIPAGIYVLVNLTMPHASLRGWAIPMATDIAFALAVLAIVGSSLPSALRAFLLTLAIVDDLGAILIIAIFFTASLQLWWLAGAVVLLGLWWWLHRRDLRVWPLYLVIAIATWYCVLQSGIHATIAGVALGLLVPSSLDKNDDAVDRWEHRVRPISAGVAVPVFALFAAGVKVDMVSLTSLFTHAVPFGIFAGLLVGKVIGVYFGAFATTRLAGDPHPSDGILWREMWGVAQLAGIGFTVSLLMCELAFAGEAELLAQSKMAVLVASVCAAIIGGAMLRRRNVRRRDEATLAV